MCRIDWYIIYMTLLIASKSLTRKCFTGQHFFVYFENMEQPIKNNKLNLI